MKRLILMRHAKSSWSDPDQRDMDRPLNNRGRRDAPEIGKWLRAQGYRPDAALISSAVRTRQTWTGLTESLPACPADFQEPLYHGSATTMLLALRKAGAAGCVLMLGHQPGIGDFARRLLEEPPQDDEFDKYPTAAVSVIDFGCDDWRDVDWRTGRLTDFMIPRRLGGGAC